MEVVPVQVEYLLSEHWRTGRKGDKRRSVPGEVLPAAFVGRGAVMSEMVGTVPIRGNRLCGTVDG